MEYTSYSFSPFDAEEINYTDFAIDIVGNPDDPSDKTTELFKLVFRDYRSECPLYFDNARRSHLTKRDFNHCQVQLISRQENKYKSTIFSNILF